MKRIYLRSSLSKIEGYDRILNLTDLYYFVEAATALNLSRASERLGISQPSLSLAIKRLEKFIGIPLFSRHKLGVMLTPGGKQLLSHAKQLLQYIEDVKSKAVASHNEPQGNIIIGCHVSVGLNYLGNFLPYLLVKYPKLDIQLKHDLSRKITEGVINLSIDLGIVVNPFPHPDLILRKLCTDEVTFWKAKGFQTTDASVLICNPDLIQTQSLIKQCKKKQIFYKRMTITDSLEIIVDLVAKGAGIGILPTSVVKQKYSSELEQIENTPSYKDEIFIVYRHENRRVKAINLIINAIINRI